MNTFKRKALFTAVVAGLGVAGSLDIYANPQNQQVLVYPYIANEQPGGLNGAVASARSDPYNNVIDHRAREGYIDLSQDSYDSKFQT